MLLNVEKMRWTIRPIGLCFFSQELINWFILNPHKYKFIDNKGIISYILIDQKVKGWSEDPGPSTGEEVPRLFFRRVCLKELSIFIDESGDFGEYSHHSHTTLSPWYSTIRK